MFAPKKVKYQGTFAAWVAEAIGLGGLWPDHFLALVGHKCASPAHFWELSLLSGNLLKIFYYIISPQCTGTLMYLLSAAYEFKYIYFLFIWDFSLSLSLSVWQTDMLKRCIIILFHHHKCLRLYWNQIRDRPTIRPRAAKFGCHCLKFFQLKNSQKYLGRLIAAQCCWI